MKDLTALKDFFEHWNKNPDFGWGDVVAVMERFGLQSWFNELRLVAVLAQTRPEAGGKLAIVFGEIKFLSVRVKEEKNVNDSLLRKRLYDLSDEVVLYTKQVLFGLFLFVLVFVGPFVCAFLLNWFL